MNSAGNEQRTEVVAMRDWMRSGVRAHRAVSEPVGCGVQPVVVTAFCLWRNGPSLESASIAPVHHRARLPQPTSCVPAGLSWVRAVVCVLLSCALRCARRCEQAGRGGC